MATRKFLWVLLLVSAGVLVGAVIDWVVTPPGSALALKFGVLVGVIICVVILVAKWAATRKGGWYKKF